MDDALFIHRIHFAFTITYHYLFPQLTMGLAPLIVVFYTMAVKTDNALYDEAARFWTKIFGINFVAGVVTGIPMEFQFGTNWARFSQLTGGVIAQPLAMEAVFSFFLESAFLGMLLFGGKKLGRVGHLWAAFLVFAGSWLSGFFIVAADAWMQHPVGYTVLPDGRFEVSSFWQILTNPWALIQYAHTMCGALVTGTFVMAAVGAFYVLSNRQSEYGRAFIRVGVIAGLIASAAQIFPTGDIHGKRWSRSSWRCCSTRSTRWKTRARSRCARAWTTTDEMTIAEVIDRGHGIRRGRSEEDLRAVLHDEAAEPRHGARPVDLLRDRHRARRPHRSRQRARRGKRLPHSASGDTPRDGHARADRSRGDRAHSRARRRGRRESRADPLRPSCAAAAITSCASATARRRCRRCATRRSTSRCSTS